MERQKERRMDGRTDGQTDPILQNPSGQGRRSKKEQKFLE